MTRRNSPVKFDPVAMSEEQLWVCPDCGAELNADAISDECPACGMVIEDEPDDYPAVDRGSIPRPAAIT